nr:hypothetical protein CFP56_41178 [Quercus suber]
MAPLPSTLSSSLSSPPNGEEMPLLLDAKLVAQVLSVIILIITLILALRKFTTNNTGRGTQTLPGGDSATISSGQDNIQLVALNVSPA